MQQFKTPRRSIFFVDDIPDNLSLLSTRLNRQGYKVGKALKPDYRFGVLFLECDPFKVVNDSAMLATVSQW